MDKWISTKDGLPTGYNIVDAETYYREPAEYIVHVVGAEIATTAMFDGEKFVKSVYEDLGGFSGEIDYWMPLPSPPGQNPEVVGENVWHDAKTNPPKTPGIYYGRVEDTNSMWLCRYRDGVWVLAGYPEQQMDIVLWADYTSFVSAE